MEKGESWDAATPAAATRPTARHCPTAPARRAAADTSRAVALAEGGGPPPPDFGGTMTDTAPTVLFVCVHNAGRSQMAAGYLRELSGGRVDVLSAGSEPGDRINPIAVQVMAEEGIDIAGETPKILTTDAVKESDVVITMGCGDTCPIFPGKRYEDWELTDPAGLPVDQVRPIRDEIKQRIQNLLGELLPASA